MNLVDEVERQAELRGQLRGRLEGELKGQLMGIRKEKRNTIIRSWKKGIAVPIISNITSVPIDEVERVIADFY